MAATFAVSSDGAGGGLGVALLHLRDATGQERLARVELAFATFPSIGGVGFGYAEGAAGLPQDMLATGVTVAAYSTPLQGAADAGPASARLAQAAAKPGFFGQLKKDFQLVNDALLLMPAYIDVNAGFGVGGGVQVGGGPRGPGWLGGGAIHVYAGIQTPGVSVGVAPGQTVTPGGATGGGFIAPVAGPVGVGGQGGLAGPGPATAFGEVSAGTAGPSFGVWWLW